MNEEIDQTCYVAYCETHDWESMRRSSYKEAQLDLEGHKGLFPDEPHEGALVKKC